MYQEKELVAIAKRENNTKRNYLVVNRLQGKHIPVNPDKALTMFDELAKIVKESYIGERLLLVGFAETATAIGAAVSSVMDCFYMQTTREIIEGAEYLFFSEAHSHATEQKLVKNDIDQYIDQIDRIVFVEDEVTTGNTILNIINIIEKLYENKKIAFSVASLLNGMDATSLKVYEDRKIRLHYLCKTNHETYIEIAESYKGDGEYIAPDYSKVSVQEITVDGYINARRCHKSQDYLKACQELGKKIIEQKDYQNKEVLVLGTEEFMFPAIYVGSMLQQKGATVNTHSTTRSPITVSTEEEYPLHVRYELRSLFDKERVTFLYDIKKYDEVIIVTDASEKETEGLYSLLNALKACENEEVKVVRWK